MNRSNLKITTIAFCFMVLLSLVSCEKNNGLLPPPQLQVSCGLGGMFSEVVPDGPCIRCKTEEGFIRMGREGQLCYDPSKRNDLNSYQMVLFTSNPADWWPSDTLYRFWQPTSSLNFSGITSLGQTPDADAFKPEHCEADAVQRSYWAGYHGGFDLRQLRTTNGDSEIENGESFSGRFYFSDFNNDCWPEFGVVTGYMERDTAFGEVIWRTDNMVGIPLELVGDTVATSSFIMVDPPEWLR